MGITQRNNYSPTDTMQHSSVTEDEANWVELIQQGDNPAFKKMFYKYHALLCEYANRQIQSPDDVEDLVQDVFFNIWKNRRTWMPQCSIRMYLYRAVRNRIINYSKHKRVQNKADWINVDSLSTNLPDPEKLYENNQLEKIINFAINRLPRRCRTIFLMQRMDGLTYNEIAQVLNISIKTVEKQMGKALKSLRSYLDKNSISSK